MSRLFTKFLLFLPLLFAIILINLVFGRLNLLNSGVAEKQIASLLRDGKNVEVNCDCNEMLIASAYANDETKANDVLVFGSSRYLQIDTSFFPGKTLFNNSLGGATIDDDLSLYWLYRQKNMIPKIVVLGLDPVFLNKNSDSKPYELVPNAFTSARDYLGIPPSPSEYLSLFSHNLRRELTIFSPSYLQLTISSLITKNYYKNDSYHVVNGESALGNVKLFDGSLNYNEMVRSRNSTEVLSQAKRYINIESDNVDEISKLKFEKFVKLLKNDGVEIIFVIAPYHPQTYDDLVFQKHLHIYDISQDYFTNFAKSQNIKFYGSFNPSDFNLSGDDFFDGVHAKRDAINKIMQPRN